jgi:hypothetical protein
MSLYISTEKKITIPEFETLSRSRLVSEHINASNNIPPDHAEDLGYLTLYNIVYGPHPESIDYDALMDEELPCGIRGFKAQEKIESDSPGCILNGLIAVYKGTGLVHSPLHIHIDSGGRFIQRGKNGAVSYGFLNYPTSEEVMQRDTYRPPTNNAKRHLRIVRDFD